MRSGAALLDDDVLTAPDGTRSRDLDHDGVMAPSEDRRLSPAQRTEDLLTRLSPAGKAGLVFQEILPPAAPDGGEPAAVTDLLTAKLLTAKLLTAKLLTAKLLDHVDVHDTGHPAEAARRHNGPAACSGSRRAARTGSR